MRRILLPILCVCLLTGCCFFNQTISGEITVGGGPDTPVAPEQTSMQMTLWVLEMATRLATWDVSKMPLDPINAPFVLMWRALRLALRSLFPWLG